MHPRTVQSTVMQLIALYYHVLQNQWLFFAFFKIAFAFCFVANQPTVHSGQGTVAMAFGVSDMRQVTRDMLHALRDT